MTGNKTARVLVFENASRLNRSIAARIQDSNLSCQVSVTLSFHYLTSFFSRKVIIIIDLDCIDEGGWEKLAKLKGRPELPGMIFVGHPSSLDMAQKTLQYFRMAKKIAKPLNEEELVISLDDLLSGNHITESLDTGRNQANDSQMELLEKRFPGITKNSWSPCDKFV